jgi:hypothetical protein
MLPEQVERLRPRYWCTEPVLGYFDGHTSDERPGTPEKSSGLKVTKVARCTRAWAAIIRSSSFRRE